MALIALLLTTLTACGSTQPVRPPLARQLPPPPDFAKPVNVAQPKEGEFLLVVAKRERSGRIQANKRIMAFRDWYARVAAEYAGAESVEAPESAR